jgi:hypothetical protein
MFLLRSVLSEAAQETRRADDYSLLGLANLFIQHGQDAVAERLVKARLSEPIRPAKDVAGLVLPSQAGRAEEEQPDWRVLEWLQKYYRDRGNHAAELDELRDSLARANPQPACAERGTGERWLVRAAKG